MSRIDAASHDDAPLPNGATGECVDLVVERAAGARADLEVGTGCLVAPLQLANATML